ncbi:restriction endonuclease [Streptomyces anulatus]|uniref:restriction endonuclease n=1 Tax=Streptomyces anulatus TaxID=1892 RepID=UPI00344A6EDD
MVAALLQRDGFNVLQRHGGAGDRGADVIAVAPTGEKLVAQCKLITGVNLCRGLDPGSWTPEDLDLDGPGERSPRGDEALSRRVQGGRSRVVPVEAGSDG